MIFQIGAIATGSFKTGFGIYQYKKGQKQLESLERPEYEIPEEIRQNLTQAQLMALEGLPTEQKQQFVENIQRTMQSGLRATRDRGLGLAGISGLAQQQTDAFRQLLGIDVSARQANQQQLATARGSLAGFKERAFDINEMQPYIQDYLQAQALVGSGTQNFFGGLQETQQAIGQIQQQAVDVLTAGL